MKRLVSRNGLLAAIILVKYNFHMTKQVLIIVIAIVVFILLLYSSFQPKVRPLPAIPAVSEVESYEKWSPSPSQEQDYDSDKKG